MNRLGDIMDRETYEAFRTRMQLEEPDEDRCEHGMRLAVRCTACEDEDRFAERANENNRRHVDYLRRQVREGR